MPCTIVVGGQYGSEGKGKVVSILSKISSQPHVVRCGGPNSGHSVTIEGKDYILRQVPTGAANSNSNLYLAAGCAIDIEVLVHEIEILKINRNNIIVDPKAVIIENADRTNEKRDLGGIASTCSGTGSAFIRRINRSGQVEMAASSEKLKDHARVENVASHIHKKIDDGKDIIIEGTQGFGLSLYHGFSYPYCTSRDTTASAFASEVGLAPGDISDVVMVIRTFPIRVGGRSGPFTTEEISWEKVADISGAPEAIPEYTSVTKKLRRVAMFDMEAVKIACQYNKPTYIALMGLDRLDYRNSEILRFDQLSDIGKSFIKSIESETKHPIGFIGTGFSSDIIFSRKVKQGHTIPNEFIVNS